MKIIEIFKDIIAPKKCYSCNDEWHFVCPECLSDAWYFENICYVCKASTRNFDVHEYCKNDFVYYDKIIILTHYRNKFIKKLIEDAKFYSKKDVFEDISIYLWELLNENISLPKDEILLIPTPMFFFKKLIRWYNQGEVLVKSLAKNHSLKYSFKLIKKLKKTNSQSHLSKIERIENLKEAFLINKNELEKWKNKTIIIVDDVVSTWSTINEIAKLLKKNWVKNVYWLCIASD